VRTRTLVFGATIVATVAPAALAHTHIFLASLNGANESPVQLSDGFGTARVTLDLDIATMRVEASFASLEGNVQIAHIHCCTTVPGEGIIGVATPTPTFPGFPAGVTAGTYDQTFDLTQSSSYNPAFLNDPAFGNGTIGGALNALSLGILEGKAYFNIHTSFAPSGEIRGFLTEVPEPCSMIFVAVGLAGLFVKRRKR
jgi:hypothetical protein